MFRLVFLLVIIIFEALEACNQASLFRLCCERGEIVVNSEELLRRAVDMQFHNGRSSHYINLTVTGCSGEVRVFPTRAFLCSAEVERKQIINVSLLVWL